MIINTEQIKDKISAISLFFSTYKTANVLELSATDNILALNIASQECFMSTRVRLDHPSDFKAAVDTKSFLGLISGIQPDEFTLDSDGKAVKLVAGKSKYTLPIISTGLDMPLAVSPDINHSKISVTTPLNVLESITEVNGKEIQKLKGLNSDEIHKLYYLTNKGCFTFSTGACLNEFELGAEFEILLTDSIVKLFKTFDSDVTFNFGTRLSPSGAEQSAIVLSNESTFLIALVNTDPLLITKLKGACDSSKKLINTNYNYSLDIPVKETLSLINRLVTFNSNINMNYNKTQSPVKLIFTGNEGLLVDPSGNTESITVGGTTNSEMSTVILNMFDLKSILDTCDTELINLKFGNGRAVILNRDKIFNMIPSWPVEMFK